MSRRMAELRPRTTGETIIRLGQSILLRVTSQDAESVVQRL